MTSNHEDQTPSGQPPSGPSDGGWQQGPPAQPYGAPPPQNQPNPPNWGPQAYPAQGQANPSSWTGAPPQAQGYAPPPVWTPPTPTYPYASWGRRVGAYLIDFAPAYVAQIPFWIGYLMFYVRMMQELTSNPEAAGDPDFVMNLLQPSLVWMAVGTALMLVALGWQWYNRWLVGGRTGQSLGKRVLKVSMVSEATAQPIGPVNAFLRDLLHVLDGAVYIGYLWPLWDAKRQTFSDMIMKTVVIDAPASPPAVTTGAQNQSYPNGPA